MADTALLSPGSQHSGLGLDITGITTAIAKAKAIAQQYDCPDGQHYDATTAGCVADETTPTFSSTAQAAPAFDVNAPAVAPESQPARVVIPSQGAGTQFTTGMTTLPPASSLPSTSFLGNTGLANATAGVSGPGEIVQPGGGGVLGKITGAVNSALDQVKQTPLATLNPLTGPAAAAVDVAHRVGLINQGVPGATAGQAYDVANKPSQIAGNAVQSAIPGAPGQIAGEAVRQGLNPINLAFAGLAPENAAARTLLAGFTAGAASGAAGAAGAPPLVQTGAGFLGGAAPSLAEGGIKALMSGIKEQAPSDLSQQLKDATVQTLAKRLQTEDPATLVQTIQRLDYAQKMALGLEYAQGDKQKLMSLSKLITAADAGDAQAARDLQSQFFRAENRAIKRLPFDVKPKPGWSNGIVEDTGSTGFTPQNPVERALGRSLSQSEQEYINSLPADRQAQLFSEAAQQPAAPTSALPDNGPVASPEAATPRVGNAPKAPTAYYHETSPTTALQMLGEGTIPNRALGVNQQGLYLSDSPDLALGQGAKGAVVEFDPAKITATAAPKVGQSPELAALGQEYVTRSAQPGAVRSVTIKGPLDSGAEAMIKTQESYGFWNVTKNADGSTTVSINDAARPYIEAGKTPPVLPAAAGGGPPKPPVTNLPLGPSGGGSLPRDLKNIGMGDDANAIVQSFRDSYAANVANMSSEPSLLRNVTSTIGGDLKDPKLAELVNAESQLNQALFNHLKSNLIEVNVKGMDPTEAQDWILQHQQEVLNAAKQADDATKAFRADALRSQYSGADIGKAQAILGKNDIMRATSGHSIYDKANNLLKEVRFGVDVGTVLQQDLKAARVGGTAALSGVIGNIASAIKGDSSRLGIYPNSAISREAQQMADNLKLGGIRTVGVEPMSGGNIASKAINTLTNVQYQGLTKVRQSIYEGLLYQNKLLGRDISDPVLRRQIADFANMATSTGNIASNAGRALIEKRLMLSPQMTRSQFAELAQPIKGLTSLTQAINTANQLAATAATFGVLYGINQAIGSPMSLHQFLSTVANPDVSTFGRITLKARDDSGNRLVWDALPQFSTERAILKSIQETQKLAKGDASAKDALLYLGDTAARYTFGRTNIVPQMALNAAGVGYAPDSGKFHYGDMPLVQRAESAAPVPLSASQAATQNTLPWKSPVGFGLNIAGGNSYAESKTSLENRYAQKQYGQDYNSLNSLQQAAVNVAARQDGNNVTDATAIRPWWTAGYEDAWSVLKDASQQQGASPILKAAAKYKDLASFMADVQKQAQKDNVPYEEQSQMLKTAASKIDQALQSTLGMDYSTIQQKLRQAALRKDPSIYPAVIAYYQANGYSVPKWLAEWNKQTSAASQGPTP